METIVNTTTLRVVLDDKYTIVYEGFDLDNMGKTAVYTVKSVRVFDRNTGEEVN